MTTVKLHSLHIVFRFHPREWKLAGIWDEEEKGIMIFPLSICFATQYRVIHSPGSKSLTVGEPDYFPVVEIDPANLFILDGNRYYVPSEVKNYIEDLSSKLIDYENKDLGE